MEEERASRSYFTTVFSCRCPRCREGKLFKNHVSIRVKRNMEMHKNCPTCGQVTDIEVGFYYGTGYVSYLIAILLTVISFLVWFLIVGFSYQDKRFFYWILFNSVFLLCLQPFLMRFSRSLWLSWFVKYDPDWEYTKPADPERIVEEQMNNW
ncbi:MAG TPA: hypothetical protein VM368_06870 [Flavisolibacter sp.]|nr:hypothetical protein [Flavisolibacter sp.]